MTLIIELYFSNNLSDELLVQTFSEICWWSLKREIDTSKH